jgi:hypothetical protein
MKIMSLAKIINAAFNYVIHTSKKFNIDESHSLKHSMEVFNYANNIYDSEVIKYPYLNKHKEIIVISAILHDMCDKKYMNEQDGIANIKCHMKEHVPADILDVVSNIISTMSYSKVRVKGYPDLGEHQLAYNIVREADLLAAYDIDRCIIYGMMCENLTYTDAFKRSIDLVENRVLNYRRDNLFVTSYSKNKSLILHKKLSKELENHKNMLL